MQTKRCFKCGETKTTDSFHRDRTVADGFCFCCKPCLKAARAERSSKPKVTVPEIPQGKKWCSRCETVQSSECFGLDKYKIDGKATTCLACRLARNKAYRIEKRKQLAEIRNKNYRHIRDSELIRARAYRARDPDRWKAIALASRTKNIDACRQRSRAWSSANPQKVAAVAAKRRASRLQRTPKWLTDKDFGTMKLFYELAKGMEFATGIPHHVDHVIPLQGALVCGLHCPLNLQILSAADNLKKHNKWNPDQ